MGGTMGAACSVSGVFSLLFPRFVDCRQTVKGSSGCLRNGAGVSSEWAAGSCAFCLIVGKVNGDGRRNGQVGSGQGTGAGQLGWAMWRRYGARGRGACSFRSLYGAGRRVCCAAARLASTSKLCNCVIYDKLPQNFAATSFRYLFGVKCCYFVI